MTIIIVEQKSGLYEIVERRVVARVVNFNLPTGVPDSAFTVKGGILAGTGAGTYIEHQPGTDGQVLVYDSAEAGGVKGKTLTVADIASTMNQWVALGLPTDSTSTNVYALAYDATNNMVYVGGSFLKLGGVACTYVGRYNLTTRKFESIGGSLDGYPLAIAISGDNVFVGGNFTGYLKKYSISGGTWATLGSLSSEVRALAITGDSVYVGGAFTNYITKYSISGGTFAALSGSVSAAVNALAVTGDSLYVGGYLSGLIKKYSISGGTWSTLGAGLAGGTGQSVASIAISGNYVFMVGNFTEKFAMYFMPDDEMTVIGGITNTALAVVVMGDEAHLGGIFTNAAGLDDADYYAVYDYVNGTWRAGGQFDVGVQALCVVGNDLMAGGQFDTINGVKTRMVAMLYAGLDSALDTLNAKIINVEDALLAYEATIPTLATNTYTPALTNVTNVSASTAYLCQWMRVGNMVTVSGAVDIDAIAAGSIEVGMALPIASTLGQIYSLGGTGACTGINQSMCIRGDVTNNRAAFIANVTDTTNRKYHFSFMYRVI